jgi:hypothetical protein
VECVFCNRNGQKVRDRSVSKGLLVPGLSGISGGEHLMAIPKNLPTSSQSTATSSGSYHRCPRRKYETSGVGYVQKKSSQSHLMVFEELRCADHSPEAFPLRHGKFQLSHRNLFADPCGNLFTPTSWDNKATHPFRWKTACQKKPTSGKSEGTSKPKESTQQLQKRRLIPLNDPVALPQITWICNLEVCQEFVRLNIC